jgi:hypothetical protein
MGQNFICLIYRQHPRAVNLWFRYVRYLCIIPVADEFMNVIHTDMQIFQETLCYITSFKDTT